MIVLSFVFTDLVDFAPCAYIKSDTVQKCVSAPEVGSCSVSVQVCVFGLKGNGADGPFLGLRVCDWVDFSHNSQPKDLCSL